MSLEFIRTFSAIHPSIHGGVLTIGNFDGVHLGHQRLIQQVRQAAHERQVSAGLVTFEPHPVTYFNQVTFNQAAQPMPRLSYLAEKLHWANQYGLDFLLLLKFNQTIASMSASEFAHLIYTHLQPQQIIVGEDFRFGQKRLGDVALLKQEGAARGCSVETVPDHVQVGSRVSSTRIRTALSAGDLELATHLLGHAYIVLGRVNRGDQLGRKLGFPTANIALTRKTIPVSGIFAVQVYGLGKMPLQGVASIGTRPTVGGVDMRLEVHILDFHEEIYGKRLCISFCKKLRDEVRFANLDLLKAQMAQDVIEAVRYFHDRA
jgi:riboflavin kinase/FMN adenylyltransferase